jgi:hypothetical protein
VKVVFPRLRQWCQQRRLHLVDIDLRWGVTKEDADNGKAIEICLREIDGSRPFFLCLLGSRYGWVPDELPPEEMYEFKGLQATTHRSITHLEIMHAIEKPFPSKMEQVDSQVPCSHAFFYFRRPECLPRPEAVPDEHREEYLEAFFERPPNNQAAVDYTQELAKLKEELREKFRTPWHLVDYEGRWDADADNPEDEKLVG